MSRLFRRALAVVGLVVLAAAAFVVWLAGTDSGLRFAWNRLLPLVPAEIEAATVDGRLIGPLIVTGLTVRTDTLRVTLQRAVLDWEPAALLGQTVNVDRLELEGVDVVRLPAAGREQEEPFALPRSIALPVGVNVAVASVEALRFFADEGAEPLVVDAVGFSLHFDDDELLLHELLVRAPLFEAAGRIDVTPFGAYASEAELDWTVKPVGYPAATGSTLAVGDARELTVTQRVEPPYALEAEVVVREPFSRLALEGAAALSIEPAALGADVPVDAVAARLDISGTLDALGVAGTAELTAPQLVDSTVAFTARYVGDAVEVESLSLRDRGSAAEISLAGRVELAPEVTVDLAGDWTSLQWPLRGEPLLTSRAGRVALDGTAEDLTADLDADVGFNGSIEGRVRRDESRLHADLEWRNLSWPQGMPQVSSDDGTLIVDGTLDDYRLSLDAGLALAAGTAGRVEARGTGSSTELELTHVEIAALDGTLTGGGSVAWKPAFRLAATLAAEGIDPGLVQADFDGRLGGRIAAAAEAADDRLSVRIDDLSLAGELRGRDVELAARGSYAAPTAGGFTAHFDAFALRSGASSVDLSGTIGDELDFEWRIDSPDLHDLWPELGGRLTASGGLEGQRMRPFVTLDAEGAGLDLPDVSIGALAVTAKVDASGKAESELDAEIGDASIGDVSIERLDASGSGNAASHWFALTAAGEDLQADLAVRGGVDAPWQPGFAWSFGLERATLSYASLAPWELDSEAVGVVTAGGVELGETCWRSMGALFCASAARRDGGTSAEFRLADLPFAYFSPFLPEGADVTGTIGANGALTFAAEAPPRVDVELATSRGRIAVGQAGTQVAGLAFGAGTAALAWDGSVLEADVGWPFERNQGGLELHAAIEHAPGLPFTAGTIDGELGIELTDLRFVAALVDGVENTAGELSGNIGVSGTVAAPRIAGRIDLTGGTARLREPGVVLENARLALIGDGKGGVAVDGEASSGGGTLQADGELSLAESLPVGRIEVTGSEVEVFNRRDAQVFVSPRLTLELEPDRVELTGRVLVPRATITPDGATEGAVRVSEDQVIVDEEERPVVASLSRPLSAEVVLELGDDVMFDGFGLTGRLAGALEIIEVPREPTIGSGELRIEQGTYEAYGQELEVRRGRLVFAGGAITRPGLDIEAVRRPAEGILVGARVQGTLNQPELSVFSEPPMPQQEQLSYLVLGRPLETTSSSEVSALSQAAMALGLRGGNFVSERLNEALGFDEFGIRTDAGEQQSAASFVIGKYLSPGLYVSYGVGLFEPVNTLRLRYTISSRWRLVTESSSEGSGGDLIYHIERGD